MARAGSALPLSAPGGAEEEADESSPRLLPRSSPTPRPCLSADEAAQATRGPLGSSGRHVRFADTLGLPLVAALCYDSFCCCESPEFPLMVGRCYGNLCCADETLLPLVDAECTASLCPASSPDPAHELGDLGPPQSSFYLCPTFLLPCSLQQLEQRVQACGVELESLLPCPSDPCVLRGVLRVLNVSYSKTVYIRATFDRWTTYYDHPANYVASCDEGRTDQFAFRLAFPPLYTFDGARLEFVLRYETPAQTYWANNGGRNYGVVLKACGGSPAQPPTKPMFWELQQRHLKSCLKLVKNRPAAVDGPQGTFAATVGSTSTDEDVPQLLKPTPLQPERPNNQVPTLMVTSTSPEKLHSDRPTVITEAKLDHSNKGGYVSTPSEPKKEIWKPCEEAKQQLRKDKSTWIGDLSTLRHAEAAFLNGDKDAGNITQELEPKNSQLEAQANHATVGPSMPCPYIPPLADDSETEDAVEEELEQLYLSHLNRLQAAKGFKDPSGMDLPQGTLKEPHIAPDWNIPVSPLDFAGSKRVLNTWLAEEISLRHGDEREQEQATDVPSGTAELNSLDPESAKFNIPPCGAESPKNPWVGDGTQPPSTGECFFSVRENAECIEFGQPSIGPRCASPISSEMEATDNTHVLLPQESGSVTEDRAAIPPYKPANFAAVAHGLSKDRTSKDIHQVLSRRCDHTHRAQQEQVPLSEEICESQAQDLKEQALSSEASHEVETLKNQQEGRLLNNELHELQITQNLQAVQLSKALHEFETLPNLQGRDRLSKNLLTLQAPLDLQERLLLSEELHEIKSHQYLQEQVEQSETFQGLETPHDAEEQVLLREELHEVEIVHTKQEQVLLSENLLEQEITHNLQKRVLLNESLLGLPSSQNLPRMPFLCEDLHALETPQNWQERVQLFEELHEIESSPNLQERVLLSEELCGLDAGKNVQDQDLLSEEICVVKSAKNLKESLLLGKEHHNLQAHQNLQEHFLVKENICRVETPQTQKLYKTFLLKEELYEHENLLSYLEKSPHLQEFLKDKNSGLQVALNPIERVLLSEGLCEMEIQKKLPILAEGHLEQSSQGIGYLSTYCVPRSEEFEYSGTSSAILGERSEYSGTCSALQGQELGFLVSSFAPLEDHFGCHSSFTAPLGEELGSPSFSGSLLAEDGPDRETGPCVEAALTLSSRFLCVVLFLGVILQSSMSFAEALLVLGAVWFL